MPYELFWHGTLNAYLVYLEKYKLDQKAKSDEINLSAWLTGIYIKHAIASSFSKTAKYPEKPFDLTPPEKPNANGFRAFAMAFNEKFKKKGEANG